MWLWVVTGLSLHRALPFPSGVLVPLQRLLDERRRSDPPGEAVRALEDSPEAQAGLVPQCKVAVHVDAFFKLVDPIGKGCLNL